MLHAADGKSLAIRNDFIDKKYQDIESNIGYCTDKITMHSFCRLTNAQAIVKISTDINQSPTFILIMSIYL